MSVPSESSFDRSGDYKRHFRVGDCRVDPGALVVQSGERLIQLKPKAMAVLIELARQPGITLTREELLDCVWKSSYVTPGVLTHAITALRRAFGDTLERPAHIKTIPRIGYRMIAPVEWAPPHAPGEEIVPQSLQMPQLKETARIAGVPQAADHAARTSWHTLRQVGA